MHQKLARRRLLDCLAEDQYVRPEERLFRIGGSQLVVNVGPETDAGVRVDIEAMRIFGGVGEILCVNWDGLEADALWRVRK